MVHDSYPARMDIDYPEKLRKDVPEHPILRWGASSAIN